jgi:hypothetical protein
MGHGGGPDAQAVTALTNQSPRIVLNFGAHYSISEYYMDLHEILYGKSSSCNNPDSDTSNAPLATPCASYGGGLYYYEDRIGPFRGHLNRVKQGRTVCARAINP